MAIRVFQQILILLSLFGFMTPLAQAQVSFFPGTVSDLQKEASLSRTPYFLYFYVDDCEDCEAMRTQTFTYSPLADYTSQNYLAHQVDGLDFGTGIDIATRYGIKQYPTVIVMGPDGDVRNRTEGFVGGGDLLNLLTQSVRTTDRNLNNRVISSRSIPSTQATAQNAPSNSAGSSSWTGQPNPASNPYAPSESLVSSDNPTQSQAYDAGAYKGNYADAYMNNQLKTYSGYNYGEPSSPAANAGKVAQPELGLSYIDDRTRPAYEAASNSGNLSYTSQKEEVASRGGVQPPADMGGWSYIDDLQKKGYQPVTQTVQPPALSQPGYTPPATQETYPAGTEPSFLDPVGAVYSPETPPATRGMDEATLMRQTESSYMDNYGTTASRSLDESGTTPASGGMKDAPAAPASPQSQKTVIQSVPGFSDYSPETVTENTFGLVVGDYLILSDLQKDIDKIESQRKEPLWVYCEKIDGAHHYKLIFGEYSGEQEAVNEGLKLGASWDKINVVNLAKLR